MIYIYIYNYSEDSSFTAWYVVTRWVSGDEVKDGTDDTDFELRNTELTMFFYNRLILSGEWRPSSLKRSSKGLQPHCPHAANCHLNDTFVVWQHKTTAALPGHGYYYCIDRRFYLDLPKLTQSIAGLKALKPAANGRYLMCKSLPYYFPVIKTNTNTNSNRVLRTQNIKRSPR